MIFLCLAGAMLNSVIAVIVVKMNIPLFLDTILTVTITLLGGLIWGVLTGILTNLIAHTFFFWGWEGYLFTLCNIATAVVTWLFMRFFPRELSFETSISPSPRKSSRLETMADKAIVLILLSFGLCLVMSVMGGVISVFIQALNPPPYNVPLVSAAMTDQELPLILTEIMSRIPINIIDRLVTAFAGFGIAVLLRRMISEKRDYFQNDSQNKKQYRNFI
jgi:hypothetical protein